MTEKQKQEVLASIRKKDNLEYWNEIDCEIVDLIRKLAQYSCPVMKCYYAEDEEGFDWADVVNEDDLKIKDEIFWLADDIRDFIIEKLETEFDAWFPYVDEEC